MINILKKSRLIKSLYLRLSYSMLILKNGKSPKSTRNLVRLTPDDGYEYFFGYYDKSPWDTTGRYLIALKAKCTWKDPAPKEPAELLIIDTKSESKDSVRTIAVTHSWNSQQGCMAQWLGPDFGSRVIYNDFRNGQYCSVLFNLNENREEKQLPFPIYEVAKDGTFALTLDFSRLHRLRPGYGYSNLPDDTSSELCPDKPCIWRIDLHTGAVTELVKYTDLANFAPAESMTAAEHKVNHLMINPSGTRFMVIHRWIDKALSKHHRLITLGCNFTEQGFSGIAPYKLSDDDYVSHCFWKNDYEILGFLNKYEQGRRYYLMKDRTDEFHVMWPQLNLNGHCSYSPTGKWVVTDTYPDRNRQSSVFLCNEDGNVETIAKVFSPLKYYGDCRCDLHPRWSRNGRMVCIDSAHDGKTAVYCLKLEANFKNTDNHKSFSNIELLVSIIIPVYNIENYLRQCIESVICQDYRHLQIIIVNDGSTDSSAAICDEYTKIDSRVLVVHKSNGGLATALNVGMDAAVGEWQMVVDGDDWLEPNAVSTLLKIAYSGKEAADIAIASFYTDLVTGSLHNSFFNMTACDWHGKETIEPLKSALARTRISNASSVVSCRVSWAKLYRISFLHANGIRYQDDLRRIQGLVFNLDAIYLAEHIVFKDIPIYHYRVRQSSATQNYDPDFRQKAEAALCAIKVFIKKYKLEKELSIYYRAEAVKKYLEIIRLSYAPYECGKSYLLSLRELMEIAGTEPYKGCFRLSTNPILSRKQSVINTLCTLKLWAIVLLLYRLLRGNKNSGASSFR